MSVARTQNLAERNREGLADESRHRRRAMAMLMAVVLGVAVLYLLSMWSARNRIDDTYGKRTGILGGRSVNGTAVLADMFRQRGSRVSSWKRLSPRLKRADTIVWVPDNFEPPTSAQRRWFKKWQEGEYGRTLIYIGRDFDAEVVYWKQTLAQAPPEQVEELKRRQAAARADYHESRSHLPDQADGGWFKVRRNRSQRVIRRLEGPWSEGVDVEKAAITLHSTFQPPGGSLGDFDVETVLEAPREGSSPDADPLVMRLTYDGSAYSRIIIVTNGSFLLNLSLVNHDHRKLASKLLDECDDPEDVVFLESDRSGPEIVDQDQVSRPPGALQMMSIWPLSAIVTHVVAVGIILCFALFPIFGRPRSIAPETRSDFAKHVEAVGALLAKTENYAYANERIQYYQKRVKRESGVSHAKSTAATSSSELTSELPESSGDQ